jgi:long-chain acyl-CoA synthetase
LNHSSIFIHFQNLVLTTLVHLVIAAHGARVGFFTGDVRRLTDDIKALRPTLLPTVPRVLGRVYAGVWKKARENYVTRGILHIAYQMKKREVNRGITRQDSFWDKLVFKNVRNQLGGRLQLVLTGSAPIEGDVLTFLRVALGVTILEGYGQTGQLIKRFPFQNGCFSVFDLE